MDTYDQLVYNMSETAGSYDDTSPFVNKQMLVIPDSNNGGSYSSSQVVFDLTSISNNGRWNDLKNAYMAIPLVINLSGLSAQVNFTNDPFKFSDYAVALKNCNTSLVESISIDYGNGSVQSRTPNINMYLNFLQHTTLTKEEEEMYGYSLGYAKDSAGSWFWRDSASAGGIGLCNNASGSNQVWQNSSSELNSEIVNEGMLKRQGFFKKAEATGNKKESVLGTSEDTVFKNTNTDYVKSTNFSKLYFKTAILPLKYLSTFFGSEDFPNLVRGAYFKITLTINQCSLSFGKDANGLLTYNQSNFQSNTGGCCPLMVTASYFTSRMLSRHQDAVSKLIVEPSAAVDIVATDIHDTVNYCGSASLPKDTTFQLSLSIAKSNFNHAYGDNGVVHAMSNCRLYVNSYLMTAELEKNYISLGQKRIKFNDISYYSISNVASGASFDAIVSGGVSRTKRMIIVPIMSNGSNANKGNAEIAELQSIFSTAPATTCPHILENFQVFVGGLPIYAQPQNYSFEHFYNSFSEINSASVHGLVGSESVVGRINRQDFESGMYKYIVVDLRRKEPADINVLQQLSIRGTIRSAKNLDFHIFVEQEKDVVMDLATGTRLG